MNPQIRHAQRACEAAKARQTIVVWFDEYGQFAVASYGETKAECAAVKTLCNAIGDAIDEGDLPLPGNSKRTRKSKRALELEAMEAERDAYQERAHEAEKQLATVSLVSLYWRQDEPEGQVSARRTLTAIAETFAVECSICRRRHGSEERWFVQRTEWGGVRRTREQNLEGRSMRERA